LAVFILPIVPHFSYSYIYQAKNHSRNLIIYLPKNCLWKIIPKNSRSTIRKIFNFIKN